MTAARHRTSRRLRRGRAPGAAVVRQARSDAGPLLLVAAALLVTVVLADATPRVTAQVGDQAVRAAVADAAAELTVSAPIALDWVIERDPRTADEVAAVASQIAAGLPTGLDEVLGPPLATVHTGELDAALPGGAGAASMRMVYAWRDGMTGVEWVAGTEPGPTPGVDLFSDRPWPVEVGLSEPVAAVLGAEAGDRLAVLGPDRVELDVTVSGVFRPTDPADPVWATVPGLLEPEVRGAGIGLRTLVGAYLSADSLPDARMALWSHPATVTRSYTFAAEPEAFDLARSHEVAQLAAGLEAAPQTLELPGPRPTVVTDLDSVLRTVEARLRVAGSFASVLLVGVLAACAAALALGGWLLVQRRVAVLRGARARGATLPALAVGPAVEQGAVALAAGALGLAVSGRLVPGPVSWPWVLAVLAVPVLTVPVLSVAAARLGDVRRTVTDRHQRRRSARVRRVRRVAAEGGAAVLAVAAVLTLRSRGLPADPRGADLLLVAAPTLAAAATGLVGARVARAIERLVRPLAAALRSLAPVLAVARGAAAAGTTVPFVALTVCVGLAGFATAVAGTVQQGQVAGSWDTVGADALVLSPGAPLDDVADQLSREPGVEAVAVARLVPNAQLFRVRDTGRVDVLAVDSEDLVRLLDRSPRPAPPGLADLRAGQDGGVLPVLVSRDLAADLAGVAALAWGDTQVEITAVGTAPELPAALSSDDGPGRPLVVVDRAVLGTAVGDDVVGDVLWAVGPGAEEAALAEDALSDDAEVIGRAAWLAERSSEPLTAGLLVLLQVAWPVLLGVAVVVVLLSAAATAPARARTLAVLRVLGLGPRGIARVMVGELLPWVLLAILCGLAVGAALAALLVGPLELRLVTGQAQDPVPVLGWWSWLALPLLGLVVGALVAVEQSVRRRERLGRVMRVGG